MWIIENLKKKKQKKISSFQNLSMQHIKLFLKNTQISDISVEFYMCVIYDKAGCREWKKVRSWIIHDTFCWK